MERNQSAWSRGLGAGSCGAVLVWFMKRSAVLWIFNVVLCLAQHHKPPASHAARQPVSTAVWSGCVAFLVTASFMLLSRSFGMTCICFLRKPGLRSGWRQ